jgi:hypothetical protein
MLTDRLVARFDSRRLHQPSPIARFARGYAWRSRVMRGQAKVARRNLGEGGQINQRRASAGKPSSLASRSPHRVTPGSGACSAGSSSCPSGPPVPGWPVSAPRASQVRTEGVPQHMHPRPYVGLPGDPPHQTLHDSLRQRLSLPIGGHPRAAQMARVPQGVGQSLSHRHVPKSPALGHRHVSLPIGPCDAEQPFLELALSTSRSYSSKS